MAKNKTRNIVRESTAASFIASFDIEGLESRQFLSAAPWSPQDKQIGLDVATQNYPSITGAGETVAIIDQGVDYNHPALGNGYGNKVIASWNFNTGNYDTFPSDGDAHGTGTSGEIAADPHVVDGLLYQGVAPGVKIISLRASGTYNMQQALNWVIAHRAQYNIVALNYLDQSGADETQFVGQLQTLHDSGVFMAGAVGNYGPGPAYAHINDLVHTVGSVNSSDQLSSFTPRGPALDLVAPAENIQVTWYYSGIHANLPSTGTSWAGPQVTGAAALVKQVNSKFSADQVYQILRDSATWVYDSYSNANYARLNVPAAIALAYQRSGQAKSAPITAAPTPTPPGVIKTPTPAPTPAPVAKPTPVVKTTKFATAAVRPAALPIATNPSQPSAFTGTPFATSTRISAANYDNGGEGVAYHDTTAINEGGDAYRNGAVDTTWNASQNTEIVGWVHAGEWMNYTVNVAKAGTYAFFAQTAAVGSGGKFHVEVDGKKVGSSIAVTNTGTWDNYATETVKGVKLKAGKHVFRVVMEKAGTSGFVGNFNWFSIAPAEALNALTGGKATAAKRRR